jgi:adenylate kinase
MRNLPSKRASLLIRAWSRLRVPVLKKAYLSFSITNASDEDIRQTEQARDKLRQLLVVFDPYSMKENELQSRADIPESVRQRISNMVVFRDYQLISQSDYVLVYYPGEQFSQGVATEIVYGYSSGKRVYLVWPHERESPFLEFHRHKSFMTLEALVAHLHSEIGQTGGQV